MHARDLTYHVLPLGRNTNSCIKLLQLKYILNSLLKFKNGYKLHLPHSSRSRLFPPFSQLLKTPTLLILNEIKSCKDQNCLEFRKESNGIKQFHLFFINIQKKNAYEP